MNSQESCHAMFLAAKEGDIAQMKDLVELGVPLDSLYGRHRYSVLQCAAIWGRFEVVEYLLLNNCDINRKSDNGLTAVLTAAVNGRRNIVKLLVQSGADLKAGSLYEWTLLHYAASRGWTDIAQIIVENGTVDVNAKTKCMQQPLMLALHKGHEEICNLLIGAGAEFRSCDVSKMNVLHYACHTGNYSKEGLAEIVKCIVERGETDLNAKSVREWTPLLYAVDAKKEDIAEILIQAGVDAHADLSPITGLSVFQSCICNGWTKLSRMIVEKGGCDLNPKRGPIPLHLACRSRDIETIKLLISAGASVNIKNTRNEMPLFGCIERCYVELIRLLVTHGAYFGAKEHQILSRNWYLKKLVLEDAQLCTQSLINHFNNCSLPAIYDVPVFSNVLPQVKTVTINSAKSTAAQEIANVVNSKIQTKNNSNVFNRHPIVLKLICVEWLIKYKATLRRTPSLVSSNNDFVAKK